jgi:hypothetical protein
MYLICECKGNEMLFFNLKSSVKYAQLRTKIYIIFSGTYSGVTISPLGITVLEGNNATVRCKYDGEYSLQGARFRLSQSTIAIVYLPDCTSNGLGPTFDNYITDCDGNKTVVMTSVNVSRNDHGKLLTCEVFLKNASSINSSRSILLTVNGKYTEYLTKCEQKKIDV